MIRHRVLIPLLVLIAVACSAQSVPYCPRGVRPYLVNYGAIRGDRFLATFAAMRFALLDEGQPRDIALVHAIDPAKPILVYRDVVALHRSFPEFASVDRDEWAFLHAGEPSCLDAARDGDTCTLAWTPDRRDAALGASGYRVTLFADSAGPAPPLADTVVTGTILRLPAPPDAAWASVSTILAGDTTLRYGFPVRIGPGVRGVPRVTCAAVVEAIVDTMNEFGMEFRTPGGSAPDSLAVVCDLNHDNILDTLRERLHAVPAGPGLWRCTLAVPAGGSDLGGYEFVALGYAGGRTYRFPATGSWSTNVNNRLVNGGYGFYVMSVGSPTWRQAYIGSVLGSFAALGYSGLFEDDTWYRVERWGVDAYPPFAYTDDGWRVDMEAFLDSIKAAIAPRPAYFNGLYAAAADALLAHTDGGMTEGFGYTHWSGYVTGASWRELCNVGLRAEHAYRRTWLALGGAPHDDPAARMYVLASYLLVADSLGMFANATNYQEFSHFPEFDLPVGEPLEDAVADVDALKKTALNGTAYYERAFRNAVVAVNPDPAKIAVLPATSGRAVIPTGGLTVAGGRLATVAASDTLGPHEGRVFLRDASLVLAPPRIDSVVASPDPAPADGTTEIAIRALVVDSSSAVFRADTAAAPMVTADVGAVGGPRVLRLEGAAAPPGVPAWYEGRFTVPIGAPPAGADIPVTVFATTGLVAIGSTHLDVVSADSSNLVRNFSFEIDNDDDGVPDYFTPYQQGFLYDTAGANAESGRRSVHARNDSLGDARGVYARVDLNQTVPEDLEVSGWSKASGVSGTANNDYSLYVDLWYTDGTPLYGQCAVFPSGTHDWAYASKVIHPLKPLRNAVVYALLRKHTGDAWFDHLALRPYRAPDAVATAAEAPAEFSLAGTYPSPCDRCVVLQVASTAPVALAVRVYDLAGATVASSRMAVGSGTTPVSFDTTPLPDGIYMFSVSGRRAVRHALVAVRHR